MTNEQARLLVEQLAGETRVHAEVVSTSNRGKKASAIKLLFKPDQRVARLSNQRSGKA